MKDEKHVARRYDEVLLNKKNLEERLLVGIEDKFFDDFGHLDKEDKLKVLKQGVRFLEALRIAWAVVLPNLPRKILQQIMSLHQIICLARILLGSQLCRRSWPPTSRRQKKVLFLWGGVGLRGEVVK